MIPLLITKLSVIKRLLHQNNLLTKNEYRSVPQLERCCQAGKISFWGGQKFWVGLLFSQFSVDLQKKKKKVIAPNWSTFLRVFCWSPKKKKVISPNCSTYFLVFCCFPKKNLLSRNSRNGKGEHAGNYRGAKCLFRGAPPPFAPLVAALIQIVLDFFKYTFRKQ